MSSSFRVNRLLSSFSKSNTRCKKDDDEDNTSVMMYTDDSSSSDNGSDNGTHSVVKPITSSPSISDTTAYHGQQRSFYDMIDDRYSHDYVLSKLVTNVQVATTHMDDRSQELPLPYNTDVSPKSDDDDDDDDFLDTTSSSTSVSSGSPNSVFLSKKSATRMLKVTTQRLTEVNKVKLE